MDSASKPSFTRCFVIHPGIGYSKWIIQICHPSLVAIFQLHTGTWLLVMQATHPLKDAQYTVVLYLIMGLNVRELSKFFYFDCDIISWVTGLRLCKARQSITLMILQFRRINKWEMYDPKSSTSTSHKPWWFHSCIQTITIKTITLTHNCTMAQFPCLWWCKGLLK